MHTRSKREAKVKPCVMPHFCTSSRCDGWPTSQTRMRRLAVDFDVAMHRTVYAARTGRAACRQTLILEALPESLWRWNARAPDC